MKKTILSVILTFTLSFHLIAQNAVEMHGQLSVKGTQIVDKNGNAVCFAGPSLFWSNNYWGGENFYNKDVVDWVHSDWNAPIIRAAMGVDASGGYLDFPENKAKVEKVVAEAIANGMYVIIDWHSHHAEDYKTEAIAFFESMAKEYGSYPNIIYEIYNEPLNISWSNVIKPYANEVIKAIRAIDKNNIIVVGTPTWSQDVYSASLDPITSYKNIAYTLHFYAGTHGKDLRNNAIKAMNNGIALMVTEWGTVEASGDGAVAVDSLKPWIQFMKDYKLTNCNWALNDKTEGASALVYGVSEYGQWKDTELTESGQLVKYLIKNWEGNVVVGSDIVATKSLISAKLNSQGDINISPNDNSITYICNLYDMNGRALYNSKFEGSQSISTMNFATGMYILQIIANDELQTFKFVK